ncbi:MAG: DNA-processing protein DprA, partial [Bacteroidota bacterium]
MKDLLYKIAITKIPKVGAVIAKNLISYCGGVQAVFEAKKRELLRVPGIGEQIATSIVQQDVLNAAEQEITFMEKHNIRSFFYLDDDYPSRLKYYNDAPVMLYYRGTTDLNVQRMVAIVGTRKPSVHGIAICEELVENLKDYGVTIISGLAYGIDVTAHRKCLEQQMDTIGVMGSGLGFIYPAQHRQVAERMVAQGGLLTEYTHDLGPDREHFPARNRIIVGMCDALIVVETARKGGSMISANKALQYNKDVFAVPGRLRDNLSSGCNHLIRTNQAYLLQQASDIAEALNWDIQNQRQSQQKSLFVELTTEERAIFEALKGKEHLGLDSLSYATKMSTSQLAGLLLDLEFRGLIRSL